MILVIVDSQLWNLYFSQDVCMPVMDGLQATRIIRSFEETGTWDAAEEAGIEKPIASADSLNCSTQRMPIIAVSSH